MANVFVVQKTLKKTNMTILSYENLFFYNWFCCHTLLEYLKQFNKVGLKIFDHFECEIGFKMC